MDSHISKLCDDLWTPFPTFGDSSGFEVLYTRHSSYGYTVKRASNCFGSSLEQLYINPSKTKQADNRRKVHLDEPSHCCVYLSQATSRFQDTHAHPTPTHRPFPPQTLPITTSLDLGLRSTAAHDKLSQDDVPLDQGYGRVSYPQLSLIFLSQFWTHN